MKKSVDIKAIEADLLTAECDSSRSKLLGFTISDCPDIGWNMMLSSPSTRDALSEITKLIRAGSVRMALAKMYNIGRSAGFKEAFFIPGVHVDVESVSGYDIDKSRSRWRSDALYYQVVNREMFKAQSTAEKTGTKNWRTLLPKWSKMRAVLIGLGVSKATAEKPPRGWPGCRGKRIIQTI